MSSWRIAAATFASAAAAVVLNPACAQDYPNRPIRIVTSNIGGSSDFVARLIGQGLTVNLGQQVVVDNRPPGVIPGQVAARALPDGYTLLATGGSFWLAPFLYDNLPYDPVKDFAPITVTNRVSYIVVVHPAVPVKSVKDLVELAKAKPGALNYASGPSGGGSHLSAELFKRMAGVEIVRIAYKGGSAALADVIGGRVQMTIDDAPTLMPNVKTGKLRVLAITSAQPSPLYPDLPTVAASGVPGYESVAMQGVFAPVRTPPALVKRLNQEIVRVLNGQEAKDKFQSLGVEVVANSSEEFAAVLKKEMDRLGKLIRISGCGRSDRLLPPVKTNE